MSKYRITIDGKIYEMEVELILEDKSTYCSNQAKLSTANCKESVSLPQNYYPVGQIENNKSTGTVVAPMPGTVFMINKSEGDLVKVGDIVLVLEAMKMENEITAPVEGVIKKMYCVSGGTVSSGEVLFEIG